MLKDIIDLPLGILLVGGALTLLGLIPGWVQLLFCLAALLAWAFPMLINHR